jgi:hypothetical protein
MRRVLVDYPHSFRRLRHNEGIVDLSERDKKPGLRNAFSDCRRSIPISSAPAPFIFPLEGGLIHADRRWSFLRRR